MRLARFYCQRPWPIRFQSQWTTVGNDVVIHMVCIPFFKMKSRKNYDGDDKHLAFSELLIPALEDGMNSVLSFDLNLPGDFFEYPSK